MIEWFALRTHSAQEERAQANLHLQNYETLLPMARTDYRKPNGLLCARIRPLFRNYLFVATTPEQRWQPVMSTPGVYNFVGWLPHQDKPPAIRPGDIDELRRRMIAVGGIFQISKISRPQDIKPDMWVSILYGPFRGQSAKVAADCGSRVEVLLQAAGVCTRMKLPRDILTAA